MACKSFWGFQSESHMITVEALVKLMPSHIIKVERTPDPVTVNTHTKTSGLRGYQKYFVSWFISQN